MILVNTLIVSFSCEAWQVGAFVKLICLCAFMGLLSIVDTMLSEDLQLTFGLRLFH